MRILSPPLVKLLSISTDPLCQHGPREEDSLPPDLVAMLDSKNGFYAFEHALHVLPSCESNPGMTLHEWNELSLWKSEFGSVLDNYLCFAENIFGEQFCLRDGQIYHFDPEQAKLELVASDLTEWAKRILGDYNLETGWSIAHNWQTAKGPLAIGSRLIPTQPFVLQGSYETENFGDVPAVESMRFRAHLWQQLRDLVPGTIVRLKVTD